jgi:glycosyltransferase involved in cell wall biosynthesis
MSTLTLTRSEEAGTAAAPLISVITPTWQRPVALARAIASVRQQTYEPVEHIVVSDGPDPALAEAMAGEDCPVRFAQLAAHDPSFRWGHRARLAGIEMARGDIIAWLDDDNAFRPLHLELLAAELLRSGAGFTYGLSVFHDRGVDYQIGKAPPQYAQIDTSMIVHRREILELATWRDEGQETIEWDLVDRWMRCGVGWSWLPEVTVDNYQTRA